MSSSLRQAIVYCIRRKGNPVVVTFKHRGPHGSRSAGPGHWARSHNLDITCSNKKCILPCVFNKTHFREITASFIGNTRESSKS